MNEQNSKNKKEDKKKFYPNCDKQVKEKAIWCPYCGIELGRYQ